MRSALTSKFWVECCNCEERANRIGLENNDGHTTDTKLLTPKKATEHFPPLSRSHFGPLDCEQSLFGQSRLSSAGLERANSRERGKRECEASESRGEPGEKAGKEGGTAFSFVTDAFKYLLEKALIFWAAVTSRMYLHYVRDRPIKLQIVKSNYYQKRFGRRSIAIPSHIAFVFLFFFLAT